MRILAIAGSLRRDSHNKQLLRRAALLLPEGVELDRFEQLKAIPPYDADDDTASAPAPVQAIRNSIAAAEALLIATPEYNASIPGVLKNALDWASRPFPDNALRGKPTAVVGASTGLFGAVWAQAEVRKVLGVIGADVVDLEVPVGRADSAFDDGRLLDSELHAALAKLVNVLSARAGALETL